MNKSSSRVKSIPILVFTLFGIVAVMISILAQFFEATDVQRWSLAYYIGVPDYIKSVAIVEECREPKFRWRGRDGESKPFTSMTYGSMHSAPDLLRLYTSEFEKQSCIAENGVSAETDIAHMSLHCSNENFVSIDIAVEKVEGCKRVTIDFFENY